MTGGAALGPEFVAGPSGVPRLLPRAERPVPERGGCALCAGGRLAVGELEHVGTSMRWWAEVLRCRACGGYRLVSERDSSRISPEEARIVLADEPPVTRAAPDILDVTADPARRGPDGRWMLPRPGEGLEQRFTRDLWVAECLAALADVLHGEDPGATGRVYRMRFVSRQPARPDPFFRAYGLVLEIELDADRLWDGIDYRPAFRHDRWPPGAAMPDWTHPGVVSWIGMQGMTPGAQAGSIRRAEDAEALARWHDPALPSIGFSVSGGS